MNVEIVSRSKSDEGRPLTDPLPEKNGVIWRWYRGDYLDPIGGSWFGAAKPWIVLYRKINTPVPFVAWKFGRWTGYAFFKAYGVDSPAYKDRFPADVVYEGSTAMHLSFRPFARA